MRNIARIAAAAALCLPAALAHGQNNPVGVVSHVKVLSDKVEDVSSMDAWKRSFIKDDMTGEQKALAIWRSVVKFRTDDSPPNEFLQNEENVHDPVKIFNVYGYGMCCCASACDEALARYIGLEARGWSMPGHSISETSYDNAWHHIESERIYYFRKPDGAIASVQDIADAVTSWYKDNPDLKGDDGKLRQFMRGEGWKKGPTLLAGSEFFDRNGNDPTGGHGWNTVMKIFDGKLNPYEYGYSQGYEVNVQLRPGERLTRNWSNKGMHINMDGGGAPDCLNSRGRMKYQAKLGDLAPGRVGNGTLEYAVALTDPTLPRTALACENLSAGTAGLLVNADAPGVLVIRMPSSYVYLGGKVSLKAVVGPAGGAVVVRFSDNNGLDWKEVGRLDRTGDTEIDLKPFCCRRYDYRLKFEMTGRGTGLLALNITHDIQHSQAPLPALGAGKNTITFSAGPQEGTVTIEGSTNAKAKGKQLLMTDFRPDLQGIDESFRVAGGGKGDATFKVTTPGDMTRIRFGAHYRARDARDGFDLMVSFDGGRNFRNAGRLPGPFRGNCTYVTVSDVPAGTKEALVRYSGRQSNTACVFDFRIDADYKEPAGGFRPVKVTYVWDEAGAEKRDVHVAQSPNETYTITCAGAPVMKSIVFELPQ